MIAPFRPSALAYFVKAADAGQISSAARDLYIAQPALSQAIARLERQLGVALLVRHPRGVSLTAAGAVFLEKARSVLRAEAEAMATAESLARSGRGALEIGFLGSPPPLTAPLVLESFERARPHADVSFRELRFPTSSTADWLANVDVALCYSPPPHPVVEIQPLWQEPRSVLLRDRHPFAGRGELLVADVLDQPFYGRHPSVDADWAGFWNLDDHRGGPPPIVTNDEPTNSLELVAALSAGNAISTVPFAVAKLIAGAATGLVALPLRDAAPATCSLVWRRAAHNPLTAAFADTARSAGAVSAAAEQLPLSAAA
jgi:DNA-binding transcriptional LysR family regulator